MYSNTLSSIASFVRSGAVTRVASALAVACALTFASGCALLSENVDRAAKGVGKVVTYYCENVTVPEIREEVRAAVNKHAAPHSVTVACADGGTVLNSAEVPTSWNLWEILRSPILFPEFRPIFVPESASQDG